jgi:hypothetical protein
MITARELENESGTERKLEIVVEPNGHELQRFREQVN